MKQKFLSLVVLCAAHIMCFAQVDVNNLGNVGIGKPVDTKQMILTR